MSDERRRTFASPAAAPQRGARRWIGREWFGIAVWISAAWLVLDPALDSAAR